MVVAVLAKGHHSSVWPKKMYCISVMSLALDVLKLSFVKANLMNKICIQRSLTLCYGKAVRKQVRKNYIPFIQNSVKCIAEEKAGGKSKVSSLRALKSPSTNIFLSFLLVFLFLLLFCPFPENKT